MNLPNPVVVIPGIIASQLHDEYSVEPEIVWSAVLNKDYERLMLHPDDTRYELREPARIRARAVFPMPYEELIEELRHNLRDHADEPVPVYPFSYDWRQTLDRTEDQLSEFIDEVIARTKLLRHYAKSGYSEDPKVNLVGHSMGGLILTGYLQRLGGAKIGKIATVGTPYRGSYEAVIKVLTGTASLGTPGANSREREAARLTPALYHLLPSFENAVTDDAGIEVDMFKVESWQEGVIETLAEFIRLNGINPPRNATQRLAAARDLLQKILNVAYEHRKRVETFTLNAAGLDSKKWLAIIGVDYETRIRLHLSRQGGKPRYDLTREDRANNWEDQSPSVETGDGTVPYKGGRPSFLKVENLVCVRPKDLGEWEFFGELGDRALLGPVGFHGLLPKVNLVQRLIVAHFKDLTGKGNDSIWARPAPDIGEKKWEPPIPFLKAKD